MKYKAMHRELLIMLNQYQEKLKTIHQRTCRLINKSIMEKKTIRKNWIKVIRTREEKTHMMIFRKTKDCKLLQSLLKDSKKTILSKVLGIQIQQLLQLFQPLILYQSFLFLESGCLQHYIWIVLSWWKKLLSL